jgi:hypothetical protein
VKGAVPLFDAGVIVERPAKVKVTKSDDLVTGIAGAVLWGPLLNRLGLVIVLVIDSTSN